MVSAGSVYTHVTEIKIIIIIIIAIDMQDPYVAIFVEYCCQDQLHLNIRALAPQAGTNTK